MNYCICDCCGKFLKEKFASLKFTDCGKIEFDFCEECYKKWEVDNYNYFLKQRQKNFQKVFKNNRRGENV